MKRFLSFLIISALLFSLCACGTTDKNNSTKIYYVNTDKTSVTAVDYKFTEKTTPKQIAEALKKLGEDTEQIEYVTTIPSGVEIKRWDLDDGELVLYFVGDYDSLDKYTEIIVRAAIVKTLVQIDGVKSVSFYINNAPLKDTNDDTVGAMTGDTFIDNFGQETDSLLSTELTLYFASADGMSLVEENRQVYYSRNVSIEKLVIEQLLKGPDTTGLLSAIPSGTKINSISISENGVCIVNFDATLETSVTGVTENATVYSIVNTLTTLDNVKQVQILVNGNTPHISNVDTDLAKAISKNDDIINKVVDSKDHSNEIFSEGDEEFVYDDMDDTEDEVVNETNEQTNNQP